LCEQTAFHCQRIIKLNKQLRANKTFTLKYISNGPANTGGYFHEDFWFHKTHEWLSKKFQVQLYAYRPIVYHKGFGLISWFWRVFRLSSADLTIVPVRCALPALFRRIFSKGTTWVVMHSLNNEQLKKSKRLAIYHVLLFALIKRLPATKVKLVVVSKFWFQLMNDTYQIKENKLGLLPNLFDDKEFLPYRQTIKERKIHLGMLSSKNHSIIYDIASRLTHRGYFCFFSTPDPYVSISSYGYEILSFDNREDYLKAVSTSLFTLCFSKVPEGWPRIAHESFLLNVPVIGLDNTGLGQQVREANGFLLESAEEVVEFIEMKPGWKLPEKFVQAYHVNQAEIYLKTLLEGIGANDV
jgi:hypothetical protein